MLFSFLLRKTDFFSGTAETETPKKLVMDAFEKYAAQSKEYNKLKAQEKAKKEEVWSNTLLFCITSELTF